MVGPLSPTRPATAFADAIHRFATTAGTGAHSLPGRAHPPVLAGGRARRAEPAALRLRSAIALSTAAALPRCLDETFEWVELSGRGRLWSWTEIAVPWFPGAPVPSVVAQVAPDEQAGLLLLAADPLGRVRAMAPGAPVRIVFRPVSDTAGIAEIAADDALAAGAPVAAESGSRASTVPQTAPLARTGTMASPGTIAIIGFGGSEIVRRSIAASPRSRSMPRSRRWPTPVSRATRSMAMSVPPGRPRPMRSASTGPTN
ncbi:MAG: OB-fold domain-containing protein [Burkholderiaceae bacterium]